MKKYNLLFISFFLTILLSSCVTNSSIPAPEWFPDYRTAYPDASYIAQRGRGDTEENARTEAAAQIAMYFKTSVNASLRTSFQATETAGSVEKSTRIENDIDIKSDVDLFAVECTEPYYVKKDKKWHCVAFINREKAWNRYEPEIENAKSEFFSMKKNADDEDEPYLKVFSYKKALDAGKVFIEKLEYARILSPEREKAYSEDRKAVSIIPSLISQEKEKCTVFLDVKGDYGNIMSSSLEKSLSNLGFKVSKNQSSATYTAIASIDANAIGDDPIAVHPSLDLKITSKNDRTVFSHQTKISQKTVAYSFENALKKSLPLLAEKSEGEIRTEQ